MDTLLKQLDETGWRDVMEARGYPACRIREIGSWVYQWLVQSPALVFLVRVPTRGRLPAGRVTRNDIELFVLKEESRCLQWARNLERGIHPDSLPPNEQGNRTGLL